MKMGINGEGIGYYDRKPIFIDGAISDERVEARLTEDKQRYARGEVVELLKLSPYRVEPECKSWERCKACNLMHLEYDQQLVYKRKMVKEALKKYADMRDIDIDPCIANDDPFEYRNSFKLPVWQNHGLLCTGMYAKESNHFQTIDQCIIHEPGLEELRIKVISILNEFKLTAYDKKTKKGIRYLVARCLNDKYQLTIVTGNEIISKDVVSKIMDNKEIVSLWQSVNEVRNTKEIFGKRMILLAGKKKLGFNFNHIRLYLSPKSFFQLNTRQAKKLYQVVTDLIEPGQKLIVEAYCGIGAMSMINHDKAEKLIGIEYINDAIANARLAAKMNKINNIEFICGDATKEIIKLAATTPIDYLIVDPPRTGMDDKLLECIEKSEIKNIVYVSCNPSTLAKNINRLKNRYKVSSVQPIDIFSQTAHVETVVLMSNFMR